MCHSRLTLHKLRDFALGEDPRNVKFATRALAYTEAGGELSNARLLGNIIEVSDAILHRTAESDRFGRKSWNSGPC